tara:strand:- start:9225 stop:9488 length:264 start_codon:yes stop_codon:yes gene_type:complete
VALACAHPPIPAQISYLTWEYQLVPAVLVTAIVKVKIVAICTGQKAALYAASSRIGAGVSVIHGAFSGLAGLGCTAFQDTAQPFISG